ncbi:glutamyl-tRNA reductase [Compostibacter hankyongensis]|uniref:Glutamyl-tRNA reductase n=1 Tax=Compostibacter hankyongensis TaxID=1007089 RepID=A0ABP8FYX1_9BACT
MDQTQVITKELSHFFLAGINYRKTDAAIRGRFAINNEQYAKIIADARTEGVNEMFILSTCNRTEIYGFAHNAEQLITLLCGETSGDKRLFQRLAYVQQGEAAVHHLYKVGVGLDSQILGDYEVPAQLKNAARFAKEAGSLGTFTERMINSILQVSKVVKNETKLSSGTVSVAFAAVQYLKKIEDIASKKILLLGVGKIGRNTCKNMISLLGTRNITLINRTNQVATGFALEKGIRFAPYEALEKNIRETDILLVATNAPQPTVLKAHFGNTTAPKTIIDLSIPRNVEESVTALPGISLINVDELSKVQDETLQKRQEEVPKARNIIREHMDDFLYWYRMRKHAVVLQAVKNKLETIHVQEIKNQKSPLQYHPDDVNEISSRIIQKVINLLAGRVRQMNGHSEAYLQMLSELFETPVKE